MRKLAAGAAVATMAAVIASCGGGGGSDALSEREYIRELEDICTTVEEDLDDLGQPESLTDYETISDLSDQSIDIIEENLADLRDLQPPEDLENDHDDYVASVEATVELFGDLRDAADDEDDGGIEDAIEELTAEQENRDAIEEDIGADECASSTEDPEDPDETTVPDDTRAPITVPPTDAPVETTEPEIPETTEPELPETTEPEVPETADVPMTMPVDTEPPVSGDISTIDFAEFEPIPGFTATNVPDETLVSVQDAVATSYEGLIEAVGGADVTEDATGAFLTAYVFFWYDSIDDDTAASWVDEFTFDAAEFHEISTPGGLIGTAWTDTDNSQGITIVGDTATIVVFGGEASEATMIAFVDALVGG